jgi:hypothetical protein
MLKYTVVLLVSEVYSSLKHNVPLFYLDKFRSQLYIDIFLIYSSFTRGACAPGCVYIREAMEVAPEGERQQTKEIQLLSRYTDAVLWQYILLSATVWLNEGRQTVKAAACW